VGVFVLNTALDFTPLGTVTDWLAAENWDDYAWVVVAITPFGKALGKLGDAATLFKKGDNAVEGAAGGAKSTLQANKAAGDAFEKRVKGQLQKTQSGVVEQVTLKTESGVKTRMDIIGRDANGNIVCTECKGSATAPLTPNQKIAFPEIQQSGATVAGRGKPGFPGGTKIPPTKVDIVRP
jgi:DnaJ-class molecular chaperone